MNQIPTELRAVIVQARQQYPQLTEPLVAVVAALIIQTLEPQQIGLAVDKIQR